MASKMKHPALEEERKQMKKRFKESNRYSAAELRRVLPTAMKVLALDAEYAALSPAQLKAKTVEFRERLHKGESLDELLPEAFAACREAAWRVLQEKHYPVQVIGGILLHQGRIAEMRTGEGKTLTSTLPAYLNGLTGKGVHIVTVNDYLARRDSEWMGKVFRYMGLTVGLIIHDLENEQRRAAYRADITYGTNNEMGFDYLRDNMVQYAEHKVQRGHAFAIVDEVDSILIDEARTPLIISGKGAASTELYARANSFARGLDYFRVKELNDKQNAEEVAGESDVLVDEKARSATLTGYGIAKAERFFQLENLMDPENMRFSHHINQAIRAHGIMKRDVDYMVADGQVLIIDEFTGRIMYGRRYNEGLHQAIEAKEGVKIENESKTLATITFQNYFRLYDKLSGMTGTAITERDEFREIYHLDVVEAPTHRTVVRKDRPDAVYRTAAAKYQAVIEQIERCNEKGQPVLVGTVSVETSELLAALLRKRGIPHNVLNAKYHAQEAEIIAQAGRLGQVTIATNMAGRGTDIKLGGNAELVAISELQKGETPIDGRAEDAAIQELSAEHSPLDELAREQAAKEIKDGHKAFDELVYKLAVTDMIRRGYSEQAILKATSANQPAKATKTSEVRQEEKRNEEARVFFEKLRRLHREALVEAAASPAQTKIPVILAARRIYQELRAKHRDLLLAEALKGPGTGSQKDEARQRACEIFQSLRSKHKNELIADATSYFDTQDEAILETRRMFQALKASHEITFKAEAPKVIAAGGLFILGTERHDSRRIDNQLRGRAGRQGDPGESRFFLSMQDDLMRLFGGERLSNMMQTLRTPEDMPIESAMVSKQIESAQKKIEGQNFAIRKNVLKYDDVMNRQRELIYGQRNKVLEGEALKPVILKMIEESVSDTVDMFMSPSAAEEDWNYGALRQKYQGYLCDEDAFTKEKPTPEEVKEQLIRRGRELYEQREQDHDEDWVRSHERKVLLRSVDRHWMDHIDAMDELKKGIGLRAYAQQDPVVAYRMESFDMFEAMMSSVRSDTVEGMLREPIRDPAEALRKLSVVVTSDSARPAEAKKKPQPRTVRNEGGSVGANDLCPCGSGKKYKKCCRDA